MKINEIGLGPHPVDLGRIAHKVISGLASQMGRLHPSLCSLLWHGKLMWN